MKKQLAMVAQPHNYLVSAIQAKDEEAKELQKKYNALNHHVVQMSLSYYPLRDSPFHFLQTKGLELELKTLRKNNKRMRNDIKVNIIGHIVCLLVVIRFPFQVILTQSNEQSKLRGVSR